MDTQRLLDLVKATAAAFPDPASPDRTKWLLIWCCDLVGELGEFIESGELVEAGDCLWGLGAVSLASGVAIPFVRPADTYIRTMTILPESLKLLDHLKKVARDGIDNRPLDVELITKTFSKVLMFLGQYVDLDDAIAAVEIKLMKRYPQGFSPEASVNRTI